MLIPTKPKNEDLRLESLYNLKLLDTPIEERFDLLTKIATVALNVPIAIVSLIDSERQWFKSKQGINVCETHRDISFCAHAINSHEIFEVEDALTDERFFDNPLVIGEPYIRFYAGVALYSPDGFPIGTLCVISNKSKKLTAAERDILSNLAHCVETEFQYNNIYKKSVELALSQHLGKVISEAQSKFITDETKKKAFDHLLNELLKISKSEFGFIGEILKDEHDQHYLKSYAITDISWNAESKAIYESKLSSGLEFHNLDTLFGWAIKHQSVIISNNPAEDKRSGGLPLGHPSLNSFLGVPVFHEGEMVCMFGLANREGGYDESIVEFLQPFIATLGQLVDAARLKKINDINQTELKRLSKVASHTNNGVMTTDANGYIEWVNQGLFIMSGYSLEDLQGVLLKDFLTFHQREDSITHEIDSGISKLVGFDLEILNYTKLGMKYWAKIQCDPTYNDVGTFEGFVVILSEITTQKTIQKSLEQFKRNLDQVLDCVFMFDAINLQFFYVNEGAIQQVGYARDELFNMHPWDIKPEFTSEKFKAYIRPLLKGEKSSLKFETVHRTKDNKTIPVEIFLQYVTHANESAHFVAIVRDITERLKAQTLLAEQATQTQAVIDNMLDGLITFDSTHKVLSWNPAAETIFGYKATEIVGNDISDLFCQKGEDDESCEWNIVLKQFKLNHAVNDCEITGIRKCGKIIDVELSISETMRNGESIFVALVSDISIRKENEEKLRYLASHDPLTNLPNRTFLRQRLEQAINDLKINENHMSALMMIDLDNFKIVNDTFGHLQGDIFLMEIATRLGKVMLNDNTLARLGGDEFAAIFNNLKNVEEVHATAEQVLKTISQALIINNQEIIPTASLGYCLIPHDGDDPDTLLRHADIAMYAAKEAGKGIAVQYRYEQSSTAHENIKILSNLRKALALNELVLYYQPIVNVADDHVVGAEALLRWTDEELGNVPPSKFIPIAESSGLITSLGDWVIDASTKQLAQWCQQGYHFKVAINISPLQFRQVDLVSKIEKSCDKYGCPRSLLEIEITEQVAMASPEMTNLQLKALKEAGFSIAMDDFGTGHSSLARLGQMPFNKLKIDRSFIIQIPGNKVYETIVRSTIGLANEMGMTIVAEGVETAEQKGFLNDNGCTAYQGWYFSKALSPEDFIKLINLS